MGGNLAMPVSNYTSCSILQCFDANRKGNWPVKY